MKKKIDVTNKHKKETLSLQKPRKTAKLAQQETTEEKLRKTENLCHLLSEAGEEGFVIHDKDVIIEANQVLADMFGYDLSKMIGMPAERLSTLESWKIIQENISREYDNPYEAICIRKDGSEITCSIVGRQYQYKGRLLRAAAFRDVTEQKRLEEKLRNEEQRFRALTEQSSDIILLVNREGIITYENKKVEELLGYKTEHSNGSSLMDNIHPEDLTRIKKEFNTIFSSANPSVFRSEVRIRHQNGSYRIFEITASALSRNNIIESVIVNLRDITARRAAETKLLFEGQRFRALADHSLDIVTLLDTQGIVTYMNPAVEKILEYKVEERIGASGLEYVHPDDLEYAIDKFKILAAETRAPVFQKELRLRDKNGRWHTFEAVGSNLVKDNVIEAIIVRLHDVTDRKLAESQREAAIEKLRESEAKYRQLFNNAPTGIYRIDFKDGRFLEANDVFCAYAGCSQEEITSLYAYDILTEESKKLFWERLEKMSRGLDVPETVEYEIMNKQGKQFYGQLNSKNIYDSGGHVVAADVVAHDITGRKAMEDALRYERDLSNTIINSLPGLFYIIDENMRFLRWNDSYIKMLGYSENDFREMLAVDLQGESDRSVTSKKIQKIFLHGELSDEADIIAKDGTIRTFMFSSKKVQYEGKTCILGTGIDVTAKKRAENELQRFAEDLEDANIALRVLMNKRNEDQKEIEERLQGNINDLVMPYLKRVNKANLDDRSKNYLNVLENNLKEVLSPFMKDFRSGCQNLTPQEIQIVDLIRQGKKTKEIAEMLNSSALTIMTHRNNIRKKLKLIDSKINLRSHILSLK